MYTVTTLLEKISVSPITLARWRLEGKGPIYIKVGGRILYDPKDIFAWLEANKRQSTSQNVEVRHG